jgi:hypothetical protein
LTDRRLRGYISEIARADLEADAIIDRLRLRPR